mgnify:CR=1 FL=1
MERKTFENGITYVTHGLLGYGDYDDSGAVERANVRYLKEKYNYQTMSYILWERGRTWKGEEISPKRKLGKHWKKNSTAGKLELFNCMGNG